MPTEVVELRSEAEFREAFPVIARREGCRYVALACGREREEALRFYERRGFQRPGYSMRKALQVTSG